MKPLQLFVIELSALVTAPLILYSLWRVYRYWQIRRINRMLLMLAEDDLRCKLVAAERENRKLRSMLAGYKYALEHRPARALPRRTCVRRFQGGA